MLLPCYWLAPRCKLVLAVMSNQFILRVRSSFSRFLINLFRAFCSSFSISRIWQVLWSLSLSRGMILLLKLCKFLSTPFDYLLLILRSAVNSLVSRRFAQVCPPFSCLVLLNWFTSFCTLPFSIGIFERVVRCSQRLIRLVCLISEMSLFVKLFLVFSGGRLFFLKTHFPLSQGC